MSKLKGIAVSSVSVAHDQEIAAGSITPRTHLARDFAHAELQPKAASLQQDAAEIYYADEYKCSNASADVGLLHFGINVYNAGVANAAKSHSAPLPPSSGGSTASSGGGKKASKQQEALQKAKGITDFEKDVRALAIQHLDSVANNVAIVIDVFARNDDGTIRMTKGGTSVPEVHCVTLYRQPQKGKSGNDYLVIDPSNASFSYVLVDGGLNVKVCTASDPLKIYQPGDLPGPDSWRDCLDIAVKMGASLTVGKPYIEVDAKATEPWIEPKALFSSIPVKELTNLTATYSSLPAILKDHPVRVNQSSDVVEAKLATFYIKRIKAALDNIKDSFIKIDPMNLAARIEQKLPSVFANKYTDNSEALKEMEKYCSSLEHLAQKVQDPAFIKAQECAIIIGDTPNIDSLLQ